MGIHIEVTLHGGEIGQALLQDPEEFYYTLKHIAADESPADMQRIASDVAQYAEAGSAEIVWFLRILADELEGDTADG